METGAAINARIDTVTLASLVCVASGSRLQPNRKSTTGMAPVCRTEMDRRHHQRFRATMDLSEDESWREGLKAPDA
jgi:putative hemolysin